MPTQKRSELALLVRNKYESDYDLLYTKNHTFCLITLNKMIVTALIVIMLIVLLIMSSIIPNIQPVVMVDYQSIKTKRETAEQRIRLNGTHPQTRADLSACFSSFYNETTGAWRRRDLKSENQTIRCNLRSEMNQSTASFDIIDDLGSVLMIRSLDIQDYGKEYAVKHQTRNDRSRKMVQQFEIIDWLSKSNQSKHSTAQVHPRYPWLQWTTPSDKIMSIIITERLPSRNFDGIQKDFEAEEALQRFLVQCYADILDVLKVLWDFPKGHLLHDDMHNKQIMVSQRGGRVMDRCDLIDFGFVRNADNARSRPWRLWISPFFYRKLVEKSDIEAYKQQHGIASLLGRSWNTSVLDLKQQVLLQPMVAFLDSKGEWPIPSRGVFGFDYRPGAWHNSHFSWPDDLINIWCNVQNSSRTLVKRYTVKKKMNPKTKKNLYD